MWAKFGSGFLGLCLAASAMAADEPAWLDGLKQVHELSSSYEAFEEATEQRFFEIDMMAIQKKWNKDVRKQYLWLLFRQYVAQADSLDYRIELLKGTRSLQRSYRVVSTLPETRGLLSRHQLMKASLKEQPFYFDNFMEALINASLMLSEIESQIPKLEKQLTQWSRKQDRPNIIERREELKTKLREYNNWRSMLFDSFPPFMVLLDQVKVGSKKMALHTKIKSNYLKLTSEGLRGPELVSRLTAMNQQYLNQRLTKISEKIALSSLKAIRSALNGDAKFFMKHFYLRTDVLDRIQAAPLTEFEKSEFRRMDDQLANETNSVSMDTLLEPRKTTWLSYGTTLGLAALLAPAGLGHGFTQAIFKFIGSYVDQDDLRMGALFGINPYALYDAFTHTGYKEEFISDLLWTAGGVRAISAIRGAIMGSTALNLSVSTVPQAARTMGMRLASMSRAGTMDFVRGVLAQSATRLADPAILMKSLQTGLTDVGVTLTSESIIRAQWPWEFIGEPNMRIRLTSALIGGFTYTTFIREGWGYTQFALASSSLAFANTTMSMILWGQEIDPKRLVSNMAYNWLVGAVMTKFMFAPFQQRFIPYFNEKIPAHVPKALETAKEVGFRFVRGLTGSGTYLTTVDRNFSKVRLRELYDELYHAGTPQGLSPVAQK